MGQIISTLRREKGMTQKEIADRLNITDKAVSKWERDLAYPDTQTIPKLAEILGISVEELLNAKAVPATGHKGVNFLIETILKAVPMAMGIAVTVLSVLGELDSQSGFAMLGIGLACVGIHLMKQK
jgi:transcriptional regulator with XRE-family HTH domain